MAINDTLKKTLNIKADVGLTDVMSWDATQIMGIIYYNTLVNDCSRLNDSMCGIIVVKDRSYWKV